MPRRSPRLLVVLAGSALGVVLLLAGSWALWGHSRPTPRPAPAVPPYAQATFEDEDLPEGDLRFLPREVDFGLIKEPTSREVELENRGEQPVRILGVTTSCHCTASQPDRTTLQPGERGKLTVTMDPRTEFGIRRATAVTVDYEGASRQRARLTVRAQFRPDVEYPQQLIIPAIAGELATGKFVLTDNRKQWLEIKDITTSSPDLRAVAEVVNYEDGRDYVVKCSYATGQRAPGTYTESISLHTTDRDYETITVKATIEVSNRIRVAPEPLALQPDPNDPSRYTGRVLLEDVGGGPVEIESVTPSQDGLRCRADARHSSRRVIEVSGMEEQIAAAQAPLTIRIVLKRPPGHEVRVRVSAALPAGSAPDR
jgi:Protein of unknown function (DUF1573)